MEVYDLIAPFVLKTYQMVNDPSTDALISWSGGNNSFVVLDSLEFAQCILPIYFKHNNFSSFIRQLNTYGFRKVDPDRWEFAHESFLRGQGHLLKNITRRKSHRGLISSARQKRQARNGDNCALSQLIQLKQEQRALDEEVEIMNRRLQATEMEPQQMMAFLAQVTDDPGVLSRLVLDKEASVRLAEKKKRLRISSPPSFSCPNAVTSMLETKRRMENGKDEKHLVGVIQPINLGSAQSSTMDISLATDGDLYTLVNSAIAAKNAAAKATATATNTGISTAWPFSSFNQNDGNSPKISIHETGGLESNSHP